MSSSCNRQRMLRLGAVFSLITLGCAPPSAASRAAAQRPLHEIPTTEIDAEASRYATAYDMVRALRPNMLATRGFTRAPQSRSAMWESNPEIKVYLDGFRYGGVESLRTISAGTVMEVRWLSAVDATIRFGTGNTAGAIAVTSRSGMR
jgi:hypothetical protein